MITDEQKEAVRVKLKQFEESTCIKMRETSLNATYYSDRIRVTSFVEGCWSYVGAQTLIAANRRDFDNFNSE